MKGLIWKKMNSNLKEWKVSQVRDLEAPLETK